MEEIIIALIASGTILLFLLGIIVFVLLYAQRRRFIYKESLQQSAEANEHLQTKIELQEQTLQLFGRELHDNIGQLLSTTKMFMGLTEQSLGQVPITFKTASQTLSQAIRELRAISKSFNSEWLTQFNLLENLAREAERINLSGTVQIVLQAKNATLPLSSEEQIMVFRIIQEAIQNSLNHAKASTIAITVAMGEITLEISIVDNGIGFCENGALKEGVGTINMRNRTELLKGAITWQNASGNGTEVRLSIPMRHIVLNDTPP